ncbi:hypothetical protein ACEWY4_015164 [Coilia grayii]|uniref:UDP-glucuronosyltransferase n=1 Tax=Coilia grayii TaxID=363190 RepID=A0ABD1JM79_9TELE
MLSAYLSLSLLTLMCQLAVSLGGKVLVFPQDGSHWVNMKVLIEELHTRGHSVTVVRPVDSWYIQEVSPYYTSITIDVAAGSDEGFFRSFVSRQLQIQRHGSSFWTRLALDMEIMEKFSQVHYKTCEMVAHMLEDAGLMLALQDAGYDLLLTDPASGGGVILAHRLKLPLVFNVRWTVHGEGHFAIAPSPLSYVPVPIAKFTDRMTYAQRIRNFLMYGFRMFLYRRTVGPSYSALVTRYFGPEVDYFQLFQAADIWLMRVDFVFEFPRPTMPNVVYMGGFQCKPAKPLPQDLEDFVQSSGEHGVIIMSLGTLVGQLPSDIADEIAAVFAELPQRVIWRYTGDRPSTLGNNTLLVKWLPQNDLLGHPNVKVFVSHGGTNGIMEAIYHGVPMVGIPLVFDQADNLSRMKAKGAATVVDIGSLDRDLFLQALQAVLHEPSYRENMQKLSRLHRDQPIKPLERALFWIEFVMRHRGAAHLRTESYKMPWYSYHSLDVMMFLLAVITTFVTVFVLGVMFICTRICCKHKSKQD